MTETFFKTKGEETIPFQMTTTDHVPSTTDLSELLENLSDIFCQKNEAKRAL